MGDHFVLLVDRLLTESTLEAAIESRNHSCQVEKAVDFSEQILTESVPIKRNCINGSSGGKLVQCRICHDEDEDCSMETPCSCCGSLKYAHRKCVQRWCNEKGDTTCEICLQEFKPGYTAPPQLFHYGGVPMNFRGNWEISRRDLHNPRFFAADRSFSDSSYDDYAASTTRSVLYCRSVAVIFVVLLVLRHTLPIIIGGDQQYTLTVFALMIMRIAGILVPIYVMARALSVFHLRRHRLQDTRELPAAMSESDDDEETNSSPQMQPQPHVIQIQ